MDIGVVNTIILFATPEELRNIADKMENNIKKLKIGDSTCIHIETLFLGKNQELCIKFCWKQ